MTVRSLAFAVVIGVAVLAVLVGLAVGARIDDHSYARVETTSDTTPSTTWVETVPTLPDTFGEFLSDIARAERRSAVRQKARSATASNVNGHPCGGDLPPCWVMMRESGGDPNAYNPDGCSGNGCYGKWQCDPGTCDGTGSEEEQDAEARRVWDGGRGCQHWDACP